MSDRAPWTDGIDSKGLWKTVQTGPSFLFDRKSTRNDAMWAQIVEARKLLIQHALAWRQAALADGWTSRPTYPDHEAEETAFTLQRLGFIVQGLARPATSDTVGSGQIRCWGPDGLAVEVGETYDWKAIGLGLSTCGYCKASPVETFRVGFAGRCCAICLPDMKRAIEVPGWCE